MMYRKSDKSIAGFILICSYGFVFFQLAIATLPWSLIPIFMVFCSRENTKRKRKNEIHNKTKVRNNSKPKNKTSNSNGPSRSIGENELYRLIKIIYKDKEIMRNLRPSWLEGLELDIYIPELKIALEFQGQQHRYPVELFGGEEKFKIQKKNDERKKVLCRQKGIYLIEYWFDEELNLEVLKEKLFRDTQLVRICEACFVYLTSTGECPYGCKLKRNISAA